ncbi:hypothetical protein PE066_13690 [Ramlibacter tataouinensis]|uniref:ParB N-terminal domain-containing protein n=1 Tax=Ramlibacter tataouinensis TaxID=94132 RepID=UPI0022F401E5|nr:ParB N-terminal domain-containing protein [Ramlibacter tataouinensis]WBY00517.1 hypothetical protein PE066_13690 [Ramlibacter tataouinensis]
MDSNENTSTSIKKLNIGVIRIDGGTQARAEVAKAVVADYAERIRAGVKFPPVVVFHDGAEYWLADGFHRLQAHLTAQREVIEVDVREGALREAILFSLGANAAHGLRRSNEDKRKVVETMLRDAEWVQWSDRKIAEICGVSHNFVSDRRKAICPSMTDGSAIRTVERGGKTYQQDTSRIGKRLAAPAEPRPDACEPGAAEPASTEPAPESVDTSGAQGDARPPIDDMSSKPLAECAMSGDAVEGDGSEPHPGGVEADEAEIAAELQAVRAKVVDLTMLLQADDKLVAASTLVADLRVMNNVLQARTDDLLAEKAKLISEVKMLRNKLKQRELRIDALEGEVAKLLGENGMLEAKLAADFRQDQAA